MLAPALPTVAIEIAARRVTVAAVSGTTGRATVTAFATEPIAPEAVTPALTGPNVVDPAAVTEALRRALDRAGLRSTRRVGLIVPDTVARVSLLPLDQLPSKRQRARSDRPVAGEEGDALSARGRADQPF